MGRYLSIERIWRSEGGSNGHRALAAAIVLPVRGSLEQLHWAEPKAEVESS